MYIPRISHLALHITNHFSFPPSLSLHRICQELRPDVEAECLDVCSSCPDSYSPPQRVRLSLILGHTPPLPLPSPPISPSLLQGWTSYSDRCPGCSEGHVWYDGLWPGQGSCPPACLQSWRSQQWTTSQHNCAGLAPVSQGNMCSPHVQTF